MTKEKQNLAYLRYMNIAVCAIKPSFQDTPYNTNSLAFGVPLSRVRKQFKVKS